MSESTSIKTISIKRFAIQPLSLWINGQPLIGKESRFRSRFLRAIAPLLEEYEKGRVEICERHAEKDANGSPIFIDEKGEITDARRGNFKIADDAALQKEFAVFLNENCIIDVTPSITDCVDYISSLVLNTQAQFSGREAIMYDAWCEAFEANTVKPA